jgi:hypothetical protein
VTPSGRVHIRLTTPLSSAVESETRDYSYSYMQRSGIEFEK